MNATEINQVNCPLESEIAIKSPYARQSIQLFWGWSHACDKHVDDGVEM